MMTSEENMPYDKTIDMRIKKAVCDWTNVDHKKMFGGVCSLLGGNIFCGVHKDFLILRLGEENGDKALPLPYA